MSADQGDGPALEPVVVSEVQNAIRRERQEAAWRQHMRNHQAVIREELNKLMAESDRPRAGFWDKYDGHPPREAYTDQNVPQTPAEPAPEAGSGAGEE